LSQRRRKRTRKRGEMVLCLRCFHGCAVLLAFLQTLRRFWYRTGRDPHIDTYYKNKWSCILSEAQTCHPNNLLHLLNNLQTLPFIERVTDIDNSWLYKDSWQIFSFMDFKIHKKKRYINIIISSLLSKDWKVMLVEY
jgi:hypothetical protein